jgi:hypothetical protein
MSALRGKKRNLRNYFSDVSPNIVVGSPQEPKVVGEGQLVSKRLKGAGVTEELDRTLNTYEASDMMKDIKTTSDQEEKPEPTVLVVGPLLAGKDNWTASFLNSLSCGEAQAILKLMRSGGRTAVKHQVSEEILTMMSALRASGDSTRDGLWYADHCTCEVFKTSDSTSSHPRWQVRLDAGVESIGGRLKACLSKGAWETLTSQTKYWKPNAHHVAYNANSQRAAVPLPLNVGAGGSISHLCDERGCIKGTHLEATLIHKDNLVRQRCTGVLLIHFQGVIVKEVPCLHGVKQSQGGDFESSILKSCVKVTLLELSEADFVLMASIFAS